MTVELDDRVPPHRGIDVDGSLARGDRVGAVVWLRTTVGDGLDWNTASRRVLSKLGFVETDRTEPDPAYGTTLFTTLQL